VRARVENICILECCRVSSLFSMPLDPREESRRLARPPAGGQIGRHIFLKNLISLEFSGHRNRDERISGADTGRRNQICSARWNFPSTASRNRSGYIKMEIYQASSGGVPSLSRTWKMRDRSSRVAPSILGRPAVFLSPGNPRHQISVLGRNPVGGVT